MKLSLGRQPELSSPAGPDKSAQLRPGPSVNGSTGTSRVCGVRAAASMDEMTRARFEEEEQEWLARAREAEQEEREQHRPFTAP